jgi:hypothetical protein
MTLPELQLLEAAEHLWWVVLKILVQLQAEYSQQKHLELQVAQ